MIGFEDRSDFDYNDVVLKVDARDCKKVVITLVSVDARLDHRVRIKFFYNGEFRKDILLWTGSHASVSKMVDSDAYDLVCAAESSGVTVFEDKNYGGNSKTFYVGQIINDLRNYLFDNVISSLKIFGNAVVKLFDGAFQKGASEIFSGDDPNLRDNPIGNDAASSLAVASDPSKLPESGGKTKCVSNVMFTEYLVPGSSGAQVLALQSLLKCLGYLSEDVAPVNTFDSVILEAVKKLQTANGIPAAGFVGPRTRDVLNAYVY